MDGYTDSTYGERFADIYDDWYHDVSDVASTVSFLADCAGVGGSALELGVGTGRLALPLAASGVHVTGIDSSPAMLARLAAKDTTSQVVAVLGDMAADLPPGPFDVVFVAYNTFFGLLTAERQHACFAAVAACLRPGGAFVIEAFVPAVQEDGAADPAGSVAVRSISADRVVLSVSKHDAGQQTALGQYVEITEEGGVRLRPWQIRFADPTELDAMATQAGLTLTERYEQFDRTPFDADSPRHVTVYRTIHSSVRTPGG